MDKNIEVDFTEFMNSLDAIGRQFIISQNIQPEKLEETCCDCGGKNFILFGIIINVLNVEKLMN